MVPWRFSVFNHGKMRSIALIDQGLLVERSNFMKEITQQPTPPPPLRVHQCLMCNWGPSELKQVASQLGRQVLDNLEPFQGQLTVRTSLESWTWGVNEKGWLQCQGTYWLGGIWECMMIHNWKEWLLFRITRNEMKWLALFSRQIFRVKYDCLILMWWGLQKSTHFTPYKLVQPVHLL